MPDLNEEILKLKAEGMSLRRIAAALGVSHVTVLKRWRAMEGDREVVTGKCRKRLPAITEGKDKQATGSISHPSRPCEESRDGGNQVVTQKPPSHTLTESVNHSGNHSRGPLLGMKRLFQGVDSESGDLFEGIKVFLESNGIEVYRMNVELEGYQVKNNGQTIRIYVQRKQTGASQVPRTS